MALQIRRGTDAERLTFTPAVGELIYTTDTKLLYVGDGITVGGTKADTGINDLLEDTTPQLGGTLDLNSQDITGVGNINNSGNITASGVVSGASGNFTSASIGLATGNFKGTFAADDSTVLIDGVSGKLNLAPNSIDDLSDVDTTSIPLDGEALVWNGSSSRWEPGRPDQRGDVVGSVYADDSTLKIDGITGISYGPFEGVLNGSIFGEDSTLLVDGINNTINASEFVTSSDVIFTNNNTGDFVYDVKSTDGRVSLRLKRESDTDLSASSVSYGSILMGRDGSDGVVMTTNIATSFEGLFISNDSTGNHISPDTYLSIVDGNVGIGTFSPSDKLHVEGSATITGTVEAASFKGSYALDDSTTIIDGINGTITSGGFVQFGGYSTTERDALTAANGMVIYNTSLNVFQGYQNSAWITFTTS